MQSPEELAREKTDPLLEECGWLLQNRSTINLSASRGVALREAASRTWDHTLAFESQIHRPLQLHPMSDDVKQDRLAACENPGQFVSQSPLQKPNARS